jgi:hypothetical protein
MTDHAAGGLIGAASNLGGATSRAFKKTFSFISNPENYALYLVLFAGIITVFKKNYVAGDFWSYAMWFGTALGLAALFYEMTASKGLVRAWWSGRLGSMVWCGALWAVAFGFSINNWVGAAAENQAEKTNLHKTAFTASVNTSKALKDAEETLSRLKGKFDWSKSLDAPESYDARIKAAEADAVFEATRNGCKSKCIAKQQLAASLKADRANAIDRAATAEEIKVAEKQVAEARKVVASTKTETSEERKDLVVLTKFAGMTEDNAQLFNGLLSIVVVSILLSFGSMFNELERLRMTSERTRFSLFSRFYRWGYTLLTGKPAPMPPVIHNHTDPHGRQALSGVEHLRRGILAAASPHMPRTA